MSFNFKYNVENLGNIEKAEITVKPLTIIAGENSSGKTFVTKSLYTILNTVGAPLFTDMLKTRLDRLEYTFHQVHYNISNPAQKDLDFQQVISDFILEYHSFIDSLQILPHIQLEKRILEFTITFKFEIQYAQQYINDRKKLKKFKNLIAYMNEFNKAYENFMNAFENFHQEMINSISETLFSGLKKNFQITDINELIKNDQGKAAQLSIDTVGKVTLHSNSEHEFSFTKTGIEEVQELSNIVFFDSPVYTKIRKALESSRKQGFIRPVFHSRYLAGFPEYIEELYSYIDQKYIETPDFDEISKEIQSIISGKLVVQSGGEIVYEDNKGKKIPLSLTAMGIGNIGIIDMLLRNNIINKGSFLIMDEPEVHLHPLWQVKLAEFLYKLAKNGANVIIATHSLDLLKAFQVIFEDNQEEAEKIIAVNKMPYSKEFANLNEYEKINTILDDLSAPYYDLYTRAF